MVLGSHASDPHNYMYDTVLIYIHVLLLCARPIRVKIEEIHTCILVVHNIHSRGYRCGQVCVWKWMTVIYAEGKGL